MEFLELILGVIMGCLTFFMIFVWIGVMVRWRYNSEVVDKGVSMYTDPKELKRSQEEKIKDFVYNFHMVKDIDILKDKEIINDLTRQLKQAEEQPEDVMSTKGDIVPILSDNEIASTIRDHKVSEEMKVSLKNYKTIQIKRRAGRPKGALNKKTLMNPVKYCKKPVIKQKKIVKSLIFEDC